MAAAASATARRHVPVQSLALVIDASGSRFCVSQRGALHLLSIDGAGSAVPLLAADGEPLLARSARFDATGSTLVSVGDDKRVRVWDVASAQCLRSWSHHKKVACVELSKDGQTVLFADRFGEVYSVPVGATDVAPALLLGHLSPVSHLQLAPSGGALLTADREGHVRSSCYPHAFVIESFYLQHTSPLQIMLPMARKPLLLTAAADGREVCLWRPHGALVEALSASDLFVRLTGAPAAAAEAEAALVDACECVEQGLVACLFAGESAVRFAALHCSWDATEASMHAVDASCTLQLPQPPVSVHCAPSHELCVLTSTSVLVFAPCASRAGFDEAAVRTIVLPPPPEKGLPAADDEDEGDGDE